MAEAVVEALVMATVDLIAGAQETALDVVMTPLMAVLEATAAAAVVARGAAMVVVVAAMVAATVTMVTAAGAPISPGTT